MKNIQIKSSIYILVGISSIALFVLAWISNVDLSIAKEFFMLVPKVVTFDLILIFIFTKFAWKWKIFKGWLVPFPNLNGSWSGVINSSWVNPETGEGTPPIPVLLVIHQSFFNISCKMLTSEMDSYSVSESFQISSERQIKQLMYIYTSKPRISLDNRSLPHDGAIVFDIVEEPSRKLKGRYWTERKKTGEINLKFYNKKKLEDFPEDLGRHPVTENENIR
jgi:hypothetical protein